MPNEEVFNRYYIQLRLRVHNDHNHRTYQYLLEKFRVFLGSRKPTPDLAREFIAGYYERSLNTQAKYAIIVKSFMNYYGDPVDDLVIKRPKIAPQVVEETDVEIFLESVRNKASHKKKVDRDILMFELYLKTGMRRAEIANLLVKDIHKDFIMVKKGKGEKDRMIPLLPALAERLHKFVRDKKPNDNTFQLKPASISNKVYNFAKKAGIDLHTHSFRHKYARDLLQRGVNLRTLQELLGHTNLNTTAAYLGVTNEDLFKAVGTLAEAPQLQEQQREDTASGNQLENIVETLSSRVITVCHQELSAKDIFIAIRVKLSQGIKVYEVLNAIVEQFGGSVKGEPSDQVHELFALYNQLGLVELQVRREGVARPYDESYWIITNFGNQVVRYLSETPK